ncbi:hypothetical protein ACLI09_05825 [Flavobacterium sp. RHBU_24]|uniref:hypothetical protein n=1 Tax=Flavobacterium sp. RHBU_24 TaxID=3391185 RepID=UPI003984CBCF
MNTVDEMWWNYGYNRFLIFKWTLVFVLLFTCFTFPFLVKLNAIYKIEKFGDMNDIDFKNGISAKNIIYRWWLAFAYTSAIFFGLSLKIENFDLKKILGSLYIMIIYTIGIVCLAYMANFILKQ